MRNEEETAASRSTETRFNFPRQSKMAKALQRRKHDSVSPMSLVSPHARLNTDADRDDVEAVGLDL